MRIAAFVSGLSLMAAAGVAHAQAPAATAGAASIPAPAFECEAYVGYDRDMKLPGYVLPTKAGARTCIPFTSVSLKPPAGYKGDFYVDEFTDAKLRERWEACKADKACKDRVYTQVVKRHPPNKEHDLKDARGRFLLGKIDEKGGDTDLGKIRRPGFFAAAPYQEAIAAADRDTSIVEFTVPVEAYERIHQHMTGDIRVRGWYMRGEGIDDGNGGRKHALIVISGGGGDRILALDDRKDIPYVVDPKSGITIPDDEWPKSGTGAQGMRYWRQFYFRLQQAGFDVLALDRRGIGISGGYSDTNTLQQARDLLDIVAALRTGDGTRALSPTGVTTHGKAAAASLRDGDPADGLPMFFMGSSRGTMASGQAMALNFDKECSNDLAVITCKPGRHDPNIKGALLLADFSSGVGYLEKETAPKDDGRGPGRDRGLFIGGIEVENNIVFFPSSTILASIDKWPSAFFARGLWCYADGLEGEMESFRRVNGPKDLVVVRGPHAYTTWPREAQKDVQDRAIAYARTVLLGGRTVPHTPRWSNMKELVATSLDVWEPSTRPTIVAAGK